MATNPPGTVNRPLELGDPAAVAALREVLVAAELNGESVRAALRSRGDFLARSADVIVDTRRLAGIEPLGPIVTLFVLDEPVTTAAAERAFAPLAPADLERLGLVEVSDGVVRARVRIVPHDDILVASDRGLAEGDPLGPNHVAGVHAPSLTLSHLTVRRQVERALDVGTGNGIQAILAARHSGHVVATDLNERALGFAAFNAQLNGVELETRAGSFFEPAAGERYGLVTCNPPYVISPESAYLFRDSGLEGDAVSEQVVRQVPAVLEEGGFATILVSWAHTPGEDWTLPLREWVAGSGCDAWLLHYGTDDPLTHAGKWNRETAELHPEDMSDVLERWLAYFERLGIEGIAYGGVILRRRSATSNWVRADEVPLERLKPTGAHIERVFASQDFLAGLVDERALLQERPVLTEHALLEQRLVLEQREWTVSEITVTLQDGLGFRAGLDQPTAGLLAALDGRRRLADAIDELARVQDVSREEVEQAVLPIVGAMLGSGFLVLS